MNDTRRTRMYIGAMTLVGLSTAGYASFANHALHGYFALGVLTLAVASSRLKVKLPGIDGTMSVNLPFLLTAAVNLSAVEVLPITCASTVVQCWPRKNAKFNPKHMTFNLGMMVFASSAASLAFHTAARSAALWHSPTLGLVLVTVALFVGQTAPVAGIVGITEKKSAIHVWASLAQLSFPYYVVGAGVTAFVEAMTSHLGWGLALGVFPVMYAIHRSYRLYFGTMLETVRPPVLVRGASAGA